MSVFGNPYGFRTLFFKECKRFTAVLGQTVGAPVITALMFLLVFAQAMSGRTPVYEGVSYSAFLVPGLIMMTVIQNAFANTSSSLIQSKVMGNLVFVRLAPIGAVEWFLAYVGAALVRCLLVAVAMLAVTAPFVDLPFARPLALFLIFVLGATALAAGGVIVGLISQKFDHIAAFTNFFITPLSFLSGVFYSVNALPDVWKTVSHFNPFFYMIDGFRYGMFGQADAPIWMSLASSGTFAVIMSAIALKMLADGYSLRK
ncbi:ABC transporter permease [Polycyclovorans algicola]|uniref:ABC transporter permease n=1 Tax=Polycyclovorans algicola TaxID=616992 RepID=UPI0004A71B5E|nr:ABC transporter permease [Polycyclovorans algicola]